jgi:hypothetical protein
MAEDGSELTGLEPLPPRQRVAWIAAIWALSSGFMLLLTMAIRALLT